LHRFANRQPAGQPRRRGVSVDEEPMLAKERQADREDRTPPMGTLGEASGTVGQAFGTLG